MTKRCFVIKRNRPTVRILILQNPKPLKSIYYFFTTGVLSHKFFHTIIGGSIIAIICATLGKPVCEFGLRIWNKNFKMENTKWFKTNSKISKISRICEVVSREP